LLQSAKLRSAQPRISIRSILLFYPNLRQLSLFFFDRSAMDLPHWPAPSWVPFDLPFGFCFCLFWIRISIASQLPLDARFPVAAVWFSVLRLPVFFPFSCPHCAALSRRLLAVELLFFFFFCLWPGDFMSGSASSAAFAPLFGRAISPVSADLLLCPFPLTTFAVILCLRRAELLSLFSC